MPTRATDLHGEGAALKFDLSVGDVYKFLTDHEVFGHSAILLAARRPRMDPLCCQGGLSGLGAGA